MRLATLRDNATAALRHLGCGEAAAATVTATGVINPERTGCAGAQSVLEAVDAVINADKVLQAASSVLGLCEQRASAAAPRGSGSGTADTLACTAEASAKDRAAAALSDAEAGLAAVSLAPKAKPAPGQEGSTRGHGTNMTNTDTGFDSGGSGGSGGVIAGAVVGMLVVLVVIVMTARRAYANKPTGAGPALQPDWDRRPMATLRADSSGSSTMTTLNPAYELAVANNPGYVEGSGAAELPRYAEVADIADASAPNAGARPYETPTRQADVPAYQVPSNDAVQYGTRTLWRRPPSAGGYDSVPTKAPAGRGAPALDPALDPARLLADYHPAAAVLAPGHKARPRGGSATLCLDDTLASEI